MTDKQVDKLIRRLDRRIMRLHLECEQASNDLAVIIGAVKAMRTERDEYRERWLRS